jgi:glycosyltransferase involved in cell wall biosynthesis
MKSEKKVLLIGSPSTETVTGLSFQFDSLLDGMRSRGLDFELVNRSLIESAGKPGDFSVARSIATVKIIGRAIVKSLACRFVYLTLGSSRVGFLRDLCMIYPAKLLGRRVVAHLHGGGYGAFYESQIAPVRAVIRRVLSRVDRIIVEGHLLREQFSFVKDFDKRVVVVPNGVPPLNDQRSSRRVLNGEAIRVLYLSNMLESKGYREVLKACEILHNKSRHVFRFDFCGAFLDTSYDSSGLGAASSRDAFLAEIRVLGLEKSAFFQGTVTGDRKEEFLGRAHVFVLPTRYFGEGQPVSIIEAMARGIPVVTTRYRGIPELVCHGENGLFVNGTSAAEIAGAIEAIVSTPETYAKFSTRSVAMFSERFTETAHVDGVLGHIFG